jgi:hypothetical protein
VDWVGRPKLVDFAKVRDLDDQDLLFSMFTVDGNSRLSRKVVLFQAWIRPP